MSDGSQRSNFERAYALHLEGNYEQARELYEFEIARDPLNVSAVANLGTICAIERKFAAAIALDARAAQMSLDPINRANALSNLGINLRTIQQHDMALQVHEEAVKLAPRQAHILHAYALTLVALQRYQEAVRWFDESLLIDPHSAACRSDRAYAVLHCGDLQAGMRAHAARWLMLPKRHWAWESDIPQWRGEDIRGKTLLVHHEQGFGDTLMFFRYLFGIARSCGRLIVSVPSQLLYLIRSQKWPDNVDVIDFEEGRIASFHAPLMDAALYAGLSWDNIPSTPYIHAEPRGRLHEDGRKKVGIVWASGQTGYEVAYRKSAKLSEFLPLATMAGLRLISLQMGGAEKEIIEDGARSLVEDMSGAIRSFADTAEIIAELDLVVTIDSAVAHLAGAMGKPVFILLPYLPCWRWRDEGETTPWYPSARLFRQRYPNSWPDVMGRVVQAVAEFFKE